MIETKVINPNESNVLNKSLKIGPLWEFSRPHTIMGTTITVLTIFFITSGNIFTLSQNDISIVFLTLISSLLANVFIVGINQIYDIDIDRINKPYLPLASGELSTLQAKWLVIGSGFFSLVFAYWVSFYMIAVVILGMTIGTLYSIPQTRFKTKPFMASFSISFVRGVLGNIGLYLSYSSVLSAVRPDIYVVIIFLTIYVLINASVIAIFKDIPDIEGDKKYNVMTFSVRLGQQKIFDISIFLLMVNYAFAILVGALVTTVWNSVLVILIHLIVAIFFYLQSRKVDPTDKISVWRFYKKIWRFFYLEYVILAFVVLF